MKGSVLNAGLLLLCLLAAGSVAASTIYKSVDERGNVQFTQTPPASGEYEIIRSGVAVDDEQADQQAPEEDAAEPAEEQPALEEDERLIIDREEAERVCQQARDERAAMEDTSQEVVRRGEDGSLQPLSEEQRSERIEELDRIIKQSCFD